MRLWPRWIRMVATDGAMMRLHRLLGAPRVDELARCTLADFDREAMTLGMLDGKGRRKTLRQHVVPVIAATEGKVDTLHAGLLSTPEGATVFPLRRNHATAPAK